MTQVRTSIGGLLALTAIVALDCWLVRLFLSTGYGLKGFLTVGLGLSAGLLLVAISSGRTKAFAAWFLGAGVGWSLAYGFALFSAPDLVDALTFRDQWEPVTQYVSVSTVSATENSITHPPAATSVEYVVTIYPDLGILVVVDALIGLSILLLAVAVAFAMRLYVDHSRTKSIPALVPPGSTSLP